ncbi:MAG: FAD-binding oxidoreductase [Candidatus Limnocylindrales bacterium]
MTDLADDPIDDAPRLIATDDERYNASLTRREDQHESLAYFWVKFDGDPTPFEPGQYMTIGVFVDGKIVQRPYSVASAPRDAAATGYELYLRKVGGGTFTPTLWDLPVGHRLRMIGPKGKFLLEPDDDRTHLFVSTGTGLAPFISMIRETKAQGQPRRTVILHGASYVDELGYRDELEGLSASGAYPVTYVPTISRASDARNAGWTGRFGRVEHVVSSVCQDLGLEPDQTVVYICGNPEMIVNTETVLMDLDFPEFHVKKELYWPKGKEPASEAG